MGIVLAAGLTPAAAADENGLDSAARILTSGEVALRTADADDEGLERGSAYWEVELALAPGAAGYVATWQREAGTWGSAHEARAALEERGVVRAYVERRHCVFRGLSDALFTRMAPDVFIRRYGDERGAWQAPPVLQDRLTRECRESVPADEGDWSPERMPARTDPATGHVRVRIPVAALGEGEHTLFVVPYGYADDGSCVHRWPEGDWVSWACAFEWGEPSVATVTVPAPAAISASTSGRGDRPAASALLLGVGGVLGVAFVGVLITLVTVRRRESARRSADAPAAAFSRPAS